MGKINAVGGWLKDADAHLSRAYRSLVDVSETELDAERIAYFEDYRERYFNDRLMPGQGVEQILAALNEHGGRPERWIDIGAGVTTLFWSIGVDRPKEVAVCDLVPEALHVLAKFKAGDELPGCYRDAMALLGRTEEEFSTVRRLPWTYHVFDCLTDWPSSPALAGRFDLITAIGCFGLARDAQGYETAFRSAAAKLAPNGRLIGVDWIRSRRFIEMEGHDNRYLTPDLTADCANRELLRVLGLQKVNIEGDPYYDSLIVWAFGRDG